MIRPAVIGGAAALAILAAAVASAQPGHGPGMGPPMMGPHGHHGQPMGPPAGHQGQHRQHAQPGGTESPSTAALKAVNARMHAGMDIAYSGDADADFARAMIPHHQGAIDMARVVLAFGKDPELRKLAEAVIKAQQEEVAWLEEWLKKNAK